MRYPCMEISKRKLFENTKLIVNRCKEVGIDVWGVTKALCGNVDIAKTLIDAGVTALADSRINNIIKLKKANLTNLILLRIPMLSEINMVIENVDICLVSEIDTLQALNKSAEMFKTKQKVMIMIDTGDLREGIYYNKINQFVDRISKLNYIEIIGVGTNLTCYGGVIPTVKIIQRLVKAVKYIESKLNIKIRVISGGNSSSLNLVWKNTIPSEINNLRIGEGILLGRDTVCKDPIKNTHQDTFVLQTEIIELKYKPSMPDGKIGFDAFGKIQKFKDIGWQHRAIVAIGKQDVFPERLFPKDKLIKVLGASSDHLILSLPENHTYKIGDKIKFTLDYGGVLSSMTSPYVNKIII